eukprot:gene722-4015_t
MPDMLTEMQPIARKPQDLSPDPGSQPASQTQLPPPPAHTHDINPLATRALTQTHS